MRESNSRSGFYWDSYAVNAVSKLLASRLSSLLTGHVIRASYSSGVGLPVNTPSLPGDYNPTVVARICRWLVCLYSQKLKGLLASHGILNASMVHLSIHLVWTPVLNATLLLLLVLDGLDSLGLHEEGPLHEFENLINNATKWSVSSSSC